MIPTAKLVFPGRAVWTLLVLFVLATGLQAEQPAGEEGRSRFRAVDIYVDSGSTPLAAYQVEFSATNGTARIVGIEGGEPGAFRQPPFYDPQAMQQERVIIASFSTATATNLPSGRTRVATIHLQISGDTQPRYQAALRAAGNSEAKRIPAKISFEERKSQ